MDQPDVNETERLGRAYARRVAERGTKGDACVTPEALLALVQREGTEEERLTTLDHVMSCAACHREYEWLKAVDQAATETGAQMARPAWWRRAPLALAASLLVAIGAALLVQSRLRSGSDTTRGEDDRIELVGPATGPALGQHPVLTWHPVKGATGYVLEIQRGDRAVVFSDTTADTTLTVGATLPAGKYRWWVREVTDGAEPRSSELRFLLLGPD